LQVGRFRWSQATAPNNTGESRDSPDSMTPPGAQETVDPESSWAIQWQFSHHHPRQYHFCDDSYSRPQSIPEGGWTCCNRPTQPYSRTTGDNTHCAGWIIPARHNTSAVSLVESVSMQASIRNRNLCKDLLRLRQNARLHNSGDSVTSPQRDGPTPGSADSISGLTESTTTLENPPPGASRAMTGLTLALNATSYTRTPHNLVPAAAVLNVTPGDSWEHRSLLVPPSRY
jgi:hypothetical protein